MQPSSNGNRTDVCQSGEATVKKAKWIGLSAAVGLMAALEPSASAQTGALASDAWTWRATADLWLPSVHSTTKLDLPTGGNISSEVNPGGYLTKLKFGFMGTLDGRRGPWSFLGDAMYLNLGDLKSKVTSITGPAGNVTVPIDVGSRNDIKSFIGTFEGGYALVQTPGARADILAGVRYASMKVKLDWSLSGPTGGLATEGGVEKTKDFLDGVVGVRGSTNLGGKWDFRYYLDGGAGSSQFTWQASAGVGYNFDWGDAVLAYRYLAYDFRSGPLSNLKMGGPQISVGFKF
jgi:hypothetical protein